MYRKQEKSKNIQSLDDLEIVFVVCVVFVGDRNKLNFALRYVNKDGGGTFVQSVFLI